MLHGARMPNRRWRQQVPRLAQYVEVFCRRDDSRFVYRDAWIGATPPHCQLPSGPTTSPPSSLRRPSATGRKYQYDARRSGPSGRPDCPGCLRARRAEKELIDRDVCFHTSQGAARLVVPSLSIRLTSPSPTPQPPTNPSNFSEATGARRRGPPVKGRTYMQPAWSGTTDTTSW